MRRISGSWGRRRRFGPLGTRNEDDWSSQRNLLRASFEICKDDSSFGSSGARWKSVAETL
ncbi:hypothetical protein Pyn_34353 [Prunus yedoensis var. nudiflora]|uniref:Uncharacterized protein n=1 Tax=Prunus yedoensis var. nudiflora TaxID=2094558 RepID=A0A314XTI4_PRUYE|nr:hypothetical protein Pyn_34353 [Prunus yedoensis var. nudiflora]